MYSCILHLVYHRCVFFWNCYAGISPKQKTIIEVATMAFLVESPWKRYWIYISDRHFGTVLWVRHHSWWRGKGGQNSLIGLSLTKLKVRLIWPSRLSTTKVIFFLNRYLSFVTTIVGIIGMYTRWHHSDNVIYYIMIAIVTNSDYGVRDCHDMSRF